MSLFVFDLLLIILFVTRRFFLRGFSPFLLISLPLVVLININNILLVNVYRFYPVYDSSLGYFFVFLLIGFLIEALVSISFKKIIIKKHLPVYKRDNRFLVCLLFYIGLLSYIVSFVICYYRYGINDMKGMNNGLLGHLSSLMIILSPLYLDYKIKEHHTIRGILLVAIGLLVSLLFGGKYVLFIQIIYLIMYYIFKKRLSIYNVLLLALLFAVFTFVVFSVLYAFIPTLTNSYGDNATFESSMKFAVEHLFYYLCSPVIASNYAFSTVGKDLSLVPFTIPINMFRVFVDNSEYVSPIIGFVFPISDVQSTNVAGIFGELFYCLGDFSFFVFSLLFLAIELIWHFSRKTNFYFLTKCYLCSIVSLLFFCNYLTVSGVVMPLIYLFIVETIIQIAPRYKKRSRWSFMSRHKKKKVQVMYN